MIQVAFRRSEIAQLKKLSQELKRFPRRFMQNVGFEAQRQVGYNLSGAVLYRRSGRLAGSIGSSVAADGLGVTIGSGVNNASGRVPYANIHIKGGTIRPKNGEYLTIPIRRGSREAMWLVNNKSMTLGKAGLKVHKQTGRLTGPSFSSKIIGFRKVKSVRIPKRDYLTPAGRATVAKFDYILAATLKDFVK